MSAPVLILGGGIAGLSASFHIGHNNCLVLERKPYLFGHCRSFEELGAVWNEGPHVSFTKHTYVRDLFEKSTQGNFREFAPVVSNWFEGTWITHPAQSNLYQVPEPLRTDCVQGFIESHSISSSPPRNYGEWLAQSLGETFSEHFSRRYTRKYWTVEPEAMGVDWIGERVHRPDLKDIVDGSQGPRDQSTHYIKTIRYPETDGYQSFLRILANNANVIKESSVTEIDLVNREVKDSNGKIYKYSRLVNTLPLPDFVRLCKQSTREMHTAVSQLACTELHLVNVWAPHSALRPENWIYVYDESMASTRISITESLSPTNSAHGTTGIQVEVYGSRFKPQNESPKSLAARVVDELITMGLVDGKRRSDLKWSTIFVPYANIIFTNETAENLLKIWSLLEPYGLTREDDDLNPITDWNSATTIKFGNIVMAGRFAQWKYFWSDDCVLRGRQLCTLKA